MTKNDKITLGRASEEFGITKHTLKKAAASGIIHMQLGENRNVVNYSLSKSEIQKNLEAIKKCKKQFPRKGGRLEMLELMKRGIRGVAELRRHGISEATIYQYYPRPVAEKNNQFYCVRLNTWTPACKINDCRLRGECNR